MANWYGTDGNELDITIDWDLMTKDMPKIEGVARAVEH